MKTKLAFLSTLLLLGACSPKEVNSAGIAIGQEGAVEATSMDTPETKTPEPKPETPTGETPKDGDEVAVFETGKGRIVAMFYPDKAPKHVAQFKMLAKKGFYDGTRFHRCMDNFMIQGGDPNSKDLGKSSAWGTGGYVENGKEVNIPAEFNDIKHVRGVLSAARSADPNSASSQFFIMQADNAGLDGQYSAWGRVITGLNVVDEIVKTGDPNPQANGAVKPSEAILLKSVKIEKWPIK